MKLFSTKTTLIVLSIAVIAGCKKDDDNNSGQSKTQLLTSAHWKQTSDYVDPSIDVDGDGDKENELFSYWDDCDQDDLLTFATNGTGTFDEGASKCDPGDPQVISNFQWKLIENESKLVIMQGAGNSDTVQIAELTASSLKVKIQYKEQGVTYSETSGYTH